VNDERSDPSGPVVVDTSVFGSGLVPSSGDLARRYQRHLVGRRVILAYQTVAELRYGALRRNWGTRTLEEMEDRLRRVTVAPVDERTASIYAELKHECVNAGHGLGHKEHDGDRWIAATAVRYAVPLVSHDRIFNGAPRLELITELESA
jgi:predicted nucleic acid-binding protein